MAVFGILFLIMVFAIICMFAAVWLIGWIKAETENDFYTKITMYVCYGLIIVGFITAIVLLII